MERGDRRGGSKGSTCRKEGRYQFSTRTNTCKYTYTCVQNSRCNTPMHTHLCVATGHACVEAFVEGFESSEECGARQDGQEESKEVESSAHVVVQRHC